MTTEPLSAASESPTLRRIALSLQYEGSSFCGWQRQRNGHSVHAELEAAIAQLDPHRPIQTFAAGRTDAGVHAAGQVVHFDCGDRIPPSKWAPALNGRLPATIRIRESVQRPRTWHACYSATYRRYRYTIHNGRRPNLFLAPWCWHRYQVRLNESRMRDAMVGMLGLHDFSAFMRSGSRRPHARTTVQEVDVVRQGDMLRIEIQASGFLYGMVRLLMAQLGAVGEHRLSVTDFTQRWQQRRRSEVREAAPSHGLCLLRAGYAQEIFSRSGWYDCQPWFFLAESDPPPDPPTLPETNGPDL